ncbi:MAG: hypothetical protein O7F75_13125 [Alphaproteobacteria bacterium]|nr:hypothetical protein [Alphaproteobacteria bacterium]
MLGNLNPPPLPFLDLMTYPVKPGYYVRIDLKEPPNQCPLWVKSGHKVNSFWPSLLTAEQPPIRNAG